MSLYRFKICIVFTFTLYSEKTGQCGYIQSQCEVSAGATRANIRSAQLSATSAGGTEGHGE